MPQSPALKKAHALARELGLTQADRHDFAATLLNRDIRSWSDLAPDDHRRLLDAFAGFFLLTELQRQNGNP